MKNVPLTSRHSFVTLAAGLLFAFFAVARGTAEAPANVGLGLRQIVETYQQNQAKAHIQLSAMKNAQVDAVGSVSVKVHLDGTQPIAQVAQQLRDAGVDVRTQNAQWRNGVITAHLSIDQVTTVAAMPGVRSVMLAPKPHQRVGKVTAESSVTERAATVNKPGVFTPQGILGRGIAVGIVSDSYNTAKGVQRAGTGVATGDLPGPGNPNGYTQPVEVIQDNYAADSTDEGRGMAEIVHDIAPAAKILFATDGETQEDMADNIRALRNHGCDIIADDVYFYDEPFFSDGVICQAIEEVTRPASGSGDKQIAYFSAAGNAGNLGYLTTFRRLTPSQAVSAEGIVKLSTAPTGLYAGGVHNVNSIGAPGIAIPVLTDDSDDPTDTTTLIMQWDDPFDKGAMTADYNLLVFDTNGNYVASLSGVDSNVSTDEPIEEVDLNPGTQYYLVLALASAPPPKATHVWIISVNGYNITSPFISYTAPTIFGHPTAPDANAVAAYAYNDAPDREKGYNPTKRNPPPGPYRPAAESFTGNGGNLEFYFDADGNRLSTPQGRAKPNFAAADGVDTSFFPPGPGTDSDNDGFPNFYGTSAAAPTATAISALMLEAAGGPQSLGQAQIRNLLQETTFAHDLDPFSAQAVAVAGSTTVRVTATGNDSNPASVSPRFFEVTFGNSGENLNQLQINLTNTQLVFDADSTSGFPFTRDSSTPASIAITPVVSADNRTLTLNFSNTFPAGQTIRFGIDRDFVIGYGGNSADFLAGADIVATLASGKKLYGAFGNKLGHGFAINDGYGLVDAQGAVEAVLHKTFATGLPRNISTRAFVGTGADVLIGGFIVQGGTKEVVVRALGPSLAAKGVSTPLPNPVLELHNANGALIAANDNWQSNPVQATEIKTLGLAPNNSLESAMVQTLGSGSYTAIVRGAGKSSGNALVEVYDVDSSITPAAELANVSTRGLVKTADSVMIGGFIIGGNVAANVVVRALGPSLSSSGVAGALADPFLEVHNGNGAVISTNDNWQQDSLQATQIAGDGLAPANALESAAALTLSPGNYTAVVRGAQGTTGIGLVEMFNIR